MFRSDADRADWFNRHAAAGERENAPVHAASTTSYATTIWAHLCRQLAGDDPVQQRLIATAASLGTSEDAAQASYDVRYAIGKHGAHGAPAYLRDAARLFMNDPTEHGRAAVLSAVADLLDPALMSDEYRGLQRRHWGVTGTPGKAPHPTPSPQYLSRSRR